MRARPTLDHLKELQELDVALDAHKQSASAMYIRKGMLLDILWGTEYGTPTAARDEAGWAWLNESTAAGRAVALMRGKRERVQVMGGYGFDRKGTGPRVLRLKRRSVVHALLEGRDASDAEWAAAGGRGAPVAVETLARGMGVPMSGGVGDPQTQEHVQVPVITQPAKKGMAYLGSIENLGPMRPEYVVKTTPVRRGPGRPPGSKNKIPAVKKGPIHKEAPVELNIQQLVQQAVAAALAGIAQQAEPALVKRKTSVRVGVPAPIDEELGEVPEGPAPFSKGIPPRFQEYIPPPAIIPPPPPFKASEKYSVNADDEVDHTPRDFSYPPREVNARPPQFQEEPAPYVIPDDDTYDPYTDRS